MKKALSVLALGALLVSAPASAEQHSIGVGYAHGKVSGGDKLKGVNVKYGWEGNTPWGVVVSGSYLKGSKEGRDTVTAAPDILEGKTDSKYYALSAGPSYRVHERVKVYGLAGVGYSSTTASYDWLNHESGQYVKRGSDSSSKKRAGLALGAGVQVNPLENVALDLSYENAPASNGREDKRMNAVNVGVGFRF